MGHYGGYTQTDFDALMALLEGIEGKFLLSSFRNASLVDFTRRNGWRMTEIRMASAMKHGNAKTNRGKVEVLTANYPINAQDKRRKA
jgi:DNA adenine methylase